MKHIITLPSGNRVTAGTYAKAWKELKSTPAETLIYQFFDFPTRAADVRKEIRRGLHDRINRHDTRAQGRKWSDEYQWSMRRASHQINTPRLIIDQLPADLVPRFRHRLKSMRV